MKTKIRKPAQFEIRKTWGFNPTTRIKHKNNKGRQKPNKKMLQEEEF